MRSSVRGFRNVRDSVRQFGVRSVFKERDALAFEGGERAVNLFVGMFFRSEGVVHLVVKKIALFFAQFDEQPDLILLFLNFPRQMVSPHIRCQSARAVNRTVSPGRHTWTR